MLSVLHELGYIVRMCSAICVVHYARLCIVRGVVCRAMWVVCCSVLSLGQCVLCVV